MLLTIQQYFVVGYKGTSPYDAGLFYCPYVPLQMVRAVGQDTFQPKLDLKLDTQTTQTHLLKNGTGDNAVINGGNKNANRYYRRVQVANIM